MSAGEPYLSHRHPAYSYPPTSTHLDSDVKNQISQACSSAKIFKQTVWNKHPLVSTIIYNVKSSDLWWHWSRTRNETNYQANWCTKWECILCFTCRLQDHANRTSVRSSPFIKLEYVPTAIICLYYGSALWFLGTWREPSVPVRRG